MHYYVASRQGVAHTSGVVRALGANLKSLQNAFKTNLTIHWDNLKKQSERRKLLTMPTADERQREAPLSHALQRLRPIEDVNSVSNAVVPSRLMQVSVTDNVS